MAQSKSVSLVLQTPTSITADKFPDDFLFGAASSAYQYEGAVYEDNRGESVWDHFSHKYPEKTHNESAKMGVDFYHRYKHDIKRMKEINMNSFRLSVSWARILPQGTIEKGVNKEALEFYNNVINELLKNGITPMVTIFHWDIPQDLEDDYLGFLGRQIIADFRDYARLCFEEFGDRVKLWCTMNEPYVYSVAGYDEGKKAPGRGSKYVNEACVAGESGREAYIVSHNMLLAHAAAVEEFRKCPKTKDGKIGIAHCPAWFEPHDPNNPDDLDAQKRALEFMFGWHMHATVHGDYPDSMKKLVGERLPTFTQDEKEKLKNSFDYVGINYYSSLHAKDLKDYDPSKPTVKRDSRVEWKKENKDGKLLGQQTGMDNMISYPPGIRKLCNYIKNNYNNPEIIITENGYGDLLDDKMTLPEILNDVGRVNYYSQHLDNLHKAIVEDGCRIKGFYAWSLLDNFEWQLGYSIRFGLFYIDYKDNMKRYPKMSAMWFKEFLKYRKKKKGLQVIMPENTAQLVLLLGGLVAIFGAYGAGFYTGSMKK